MEENRYRHVEQAVLSLFCDCACALAAVKDAVLRLQRRPSALLDLRCARQLSGRRVGTRGSLLSSNHAMYRSGRYAAGPTSNGSRCLATV